MVRPNETTIFCKRSIMKFTHNIKSKRKYTTPTIKLIEVEADRLLQDVSGTGTGENPRPEPGGGGGESGNSRAKSFAGFDFSIEFEAEDY